MARPADLVTRDEVAVLYLIGPDDQAGITAAWERLEAEVGSLRGRHFFGTLDPATGEYWACVEAVAGDADAHPSLTPGRLAGGRYARVRLSGPPPGIYQSIRPTMEELDTRLDRDPSRPVIEHYRRVDQIDCLLPVV